MELCVLEDKLERLISRAEATVPPPVEYFVEELTCVRQWSTLNHPYWLVFEVEGRLQIRPEQFVVARHLIDNPGSICQLNMGRGKTRVILPMLFLYYRYKAPTYVVRVHFLAPLLSETRQFMHRVLSAGVLRLPFTELPFNRTTKLDLDAVLVMQEAVDEAKRHGGFMMIAPEHRLSLELKRAELQLELEDDTDTDQDEPKICEALDTLLNTRQYIDVFDESDALLHHKYHLVYAVGTPAVLDGGSSRWLVAEALLRVLMNSTSTRVSRLLQSSPGMFSERTEYSSRLGAFNGFQLNAVTDDHAPPNRLAFKKALVEDLMDHAPFELSWLQVFSARNPTIRAELASVLCDCNVKSDPILEKLPDEIENVTQQLLSLRGLLAYGVLETCLEKRNRVNYGLPNPGTRPKLPFTAADLPAERSEFSHPDVSIVLTLLAYYHAGLTDQDIHKTFTTLLRLDHSERIRYYADWYASIEPPLDPARRELLCDLDHISLDNVHQFGVVCDAFRYSMEVVNFFLNKLVFPRDTKQYPKRLTRSAWDLVRGPTKIGFSGTNDTHRLLPVGVAQREPDEASLRGTNGKMIDLLLSTTNGYEALRHESRTEIATANTAVWQRLLTQALTLSCCALIDTGALLAGVGIDGAARFLLAHDEFKGGGVTYYDKRKEFDCWVVLERERQLLCPLKASSLHERDTFVIFDEARSRGSDMKLYPDAVALLTLGPTITKDKLMQGAGRLRQLGRNQKLWLSSTVDVHDCIMNQQHKLCNLHTRAGAHKVGVLDVLNWVMHNTQQQSTAGLLEWADNGIRFCESVASRENELQDEDWTLERMYGDAVVDRVMADVVMDRLHISSSLQGDHEDAMAMADKIGTRSRIYGREDTVRVTGFGEECERELQVEEEEEVEDEPPSLVLEPCSDESWNYRVLLNATSVHDLRNAVKIVSVYDAAKKYFSPKGCQRMAWQHLKLYGTANFWTTVLRPSPKSEFVWNGFLRMADAVLVFPDGAVLMLSEREADAVLKMLLVDETHSTTTTRRDRGGYFGLVHVDFALHAISTSDDDEDDDDEDEDEDGDDEGEEQASGAHACGSIPLASVPLSLGFAAGKVQVPPTLSISISIAAVAACRLLNGDTHFVSHKHAALMEQVLRPLIAPLRKREETLRGFMEARRMTQRWSLSFLQDLAKRMDLEDCVI